MSDPLHLTRFRRWMISSPPGEWVLSHLRDLLIGALKQGPIPRHVAFVMDGNRRFARDHRIETIEGHNLGFEALARILEVCYKAGVEVVTVYAFSIENFKRSRYEVDALMDMAKVKVSQMAQHGDLLDRYGACIRFLGNPELLKPDVRRVMEEAEELTKHNTHAVFNVCCPYTSRDEITTAVRTTVAEYTRPQPSTASKRPFSETSITRNIRSHKLSSLREEITIDDFPPEQESSSKTPSTSTSTSTSADEHDRSPSPSGFSSSTTLNTPDSPPTSYSDSSATATSIPNPNTTTPTLPDPEKITAQTLTSHMFTKDLPPLDLLIRTSGVERLSDFMLWQCHESTSIVFLKCLWPQFDLWQFLPVLVEWQWWRRRTIGEDAAAAKLA